MDDRQDRAMRYHEFNYRAENDLGDGEKARAPMGSRVDILPDDRMNIFRDVADPTHLNSHRRAGAGS